MPEDIGETGRPGISAGGDRGEASRSSAAGESAAARRTPTSTSCSRTNPTDAAAARPGAVRHAGRGGEVGGKVAGWGVWAAEVLDTATVGAHKGAGLVPLKELVPNTRKFCLRLREAAK